MPPYVPVEAVQVDMTWIWDGQRCQNVIHYAVDSPPTPVNMTGLGNAIVAAVTAGYLAFLPTSLSLVEVKVTDLHTQISPAVFVTSGLPKTGTNVSPSLPNNCAMVITKRTALRGRSYRGRWYQMGLVEAQVNANAITPTYQGHYLAFLSSLLTFTTGGEVFDMAVVSKKQGGNWLTQGIVTPVTGFTTDGLVDSQRRRLPGRGS